MAEEGLPGEVGEVEPPGGLNDALACVGSKLDDLRGGSIGKVEHAMADVYDRAPTWLIVRVGRFGKRAAVPFDYVVPGVGHVWTPFAREVIRAATELDPRPGLTAGDERALATHYGIPDGSGRHG